MSEALAMSIDFMIMSVQGVFYGFALDPRDRDEKRRAERAGVSVVGTSNLLSCCTPSSRYEHSVPGILLNPILS